LQKTQHSTAAAANVREQLEGATGGKLRELFCAELNLGQAPPASLRHRHGAANTTQQLWREHCPHRGFGGQFSLGGRR